MFKSFKRQTLSTLLSLLSLTAASSSLIAEDCCYNPCSNRIYIGGFGGEAFSNSTKIVQRGTAYFTEAEGGPLAVDARGHSRRTNSGFGGVQIGYEWLQSAYSCGCSNWNFTPAAEVEAIFFRQTKKGHLINPTLRLPEHDFADKFPMNVQMYMFNGVLSLNNCYSNFSPYVGGGIGAARISIRRADSLQVAPLEAGVNHFNSDRSDAAWTFAAQAKAGLRYTICNRVHLFGEYRYFYLDSSRYILGSTVYPTHAPTSTWNVDVKSISYNAFAFGIQVDL